MLGTTGSPPGPDRRAWPRPGCARRCERRWWRRARPRTRPRAAPRRAGRRGRAASAPRRCGGPARGAPRWCPGRPRSSTIRSSPSIRMTTTPAAPEPAGWRAQASRSSSEKRVGRPVAGVDLGGGLRLGADDVEPAGDPLNLGHVAGHERGLDRTPSTPPAESSRYSTVSAPGTAHPAAVKRHSAIGVLGVDHALDRTPQQRVAGRRRSARRRAERRTGTPPRRHARK